jgi:hypothetical protein
MRVETHNVYDPDKPKEITPREEFEFNLDRTDTVLKYLKEIKPEAVEDYVDALNNRLLEAVEGFESPQFDVGELLEDLPDISGYPDLVESIVLFTCMQLGIKEGNLDGKVEVTSLMYTKSFRRLGYHRVKALVELLGVEEGVPVYKEIVARKLRADRATLDDKTSALETMPQAVKNWTNIGLADFTVAVIDDHRVLYRFDSCLVPESLRDFNDPDIAYLASCYTGDSPEFNPGRKRYMRRTQTLHHGTFCDEFYWDVDVYPDPEQPTLEFTRTLGK